MRVSVNPRKVLLSTGIFVVLLLLAAVLYYREHIVAFAATGALPPSTILPQFLALALVLVAFSMSAKVVVQSSLQERLLRISQTRFTQLYMGSPVPYVTIDAAGVVTLVNLSALRLFGKKEDELSGAVLTELLTHEKENTLSALLGKIAGGVTVDKAEVQILNNEGQAVWVLLSVFAYSGTQERLVSLVDISKQKAVEAAKTEFVSLASHQLRTPIAAMRWNLELLHAQELTQTQTKYIEKVERNAVRMATLIDDFLNVSKLELGTFATKTTVVSLLEFMQSVEDEFEAQIHKKRLEIKTTHDPEDLMMQVDPRLLHIIVSNLFSNAVKYTPEDGCVSLGYVVRGNDVVITVADTGVGVPADEMQQLFKKFYRASNVRIEVPEGTGLGLHLVKRSAELLGGSVAVDSKEGVGTTFTVTLPLLR